MLRAFLSLLGITIGIFCIALILTFVDSIKANLEDSLSRLGKNVIYVQKWPWLFSSEYPWWEFVNRPDPTYREMKMLQKRLTKAGGVGFRSGIGREIVKAGKREVSNVSVKAVSGDFARIHDLIFSEGRFFSLNEAHSGKAVIVIGHELAKELFPGRSAVGEKLKVLGYRFTVVGVLKKEGESILRNASFDQQVFVPVNFARMTFSDEKFRGGAILIKGKKGLSLTGVESELHGIMRSIRRISPREKSNFALNRVTLLTNELDDIFKVANIAGWIIAGFSILVGGFGVANIMFVSVKERTHIIGIQKALGATRFFIMMQFLGEAVLLCIAGGILGLALVVLVALLADSVVDFNVIISLKNVLLGIALSSLIGILAGFFPAYQASRMDPVTAIRYSF